QQPFPIYSLVGGKWTSFRAFSEEATDKALADLGQTRKQHTTHMAFGGGRDYPQSDADLTTWMEKVHAGTGLPEARIRTLFERYGTRAAQIAAYVAAGGDIALTHLPDYSQREIAYLASEEKVMRLDDVILRRSLIGFLGLATPDVIRELADVLAKVLEWSDERKQEEIDRTCALLREKHLVEL
ncbi:MAG: glycerol-3-phosphate dehydrogenase/oxidase, partial [Chloroflexi bacterium]|nr:glycerol-3-phosphate dehydrogenase/oxidase [Chloroflexota bacterium]